MAIDAFPGVELENLIETVYDSIGVIVGKAILGEAV